MLTRGIIGAVVVVAAVVVIQGRSTRSTGDAPASEAASAALPRLVDLGSSYCIPCKKMAPILEELRTEQARAFVTDVIDVREDPEAAERYEIRVIPTQIFLDAAGTERFRHEGFLSKEAILAKWEELGVPVVAGGASPGGSPGPDPPGDL